MHIYQPYTYLIGWSKLNIWYYGVRYAKNCCTTELWKTYFTSSKYVQQFREYNGEPDIIEIRQTFKTKINAQKWEKRVLKRLNVINSPKWLNQGISGYPGGWNQGVPCSEQQKEAISKANLGRKRPDLREYNKKHKSSSMKGKPKSKEQKEKMRKAKLGKVASEQAKHNMKLAWIIRKSKLTNHLY